MKRMLFYNLDDVIDNRDMTAEVAEFAERFGLSGDAWANYLAYRLISDENVFSLCAERGCAFGTVRELAREDIDVIIELFTRPVRDELIDYTAGKEKKNYAATRIKRLGKQLKHFAESGQDVAFTDALADEYAYGGVGMLGLYSAFCLSEEGKLEPIPNFAPKSFDALVGYEEQKKALIDNTMAFIEGETFNNVLLYGDAGTGKSTSVKALAEKFGESVKLIEIYKHQYCRIGRLMSELAERGGKYILFFDDLSFDDGENEYKYFKAVLDGGLSTKPDNIVVYATSNRVHLIRESFSDRADITQDEIHRSDTVEEKLSLSSRFGLSLFYPSPDQKQYLDIVRELASSSGIEMSAEKLDGEAMRWATAQNKKSGRTAEQFINSLKGGAKEL